MTTFRVFLADGTTVDIDAPAPNVARDKARDIHPGIRILKVKVLKGA